MGKNKTYLINKEKVAFRVIDGEAVILNLDNGYYYSLNDVGTMVWGALEKKKSVDSIIGLLKNEYCMPEDRIKVDLFDLLRDLEKEELLEVSGQATSVKKK